MTDNTEKTQIQTQEKKKVAATTKGTKRAPDAADKAPTTKKRATTAKAAPAAEGDEEKKETGDEVVEPTVAEFVDQIIQVRINEQLRSKKELEMLRQLKKIYKRELREVSKTKTRKVRRGDTKREPSGIATDKYMSPALCEFLGYPEGTRLPRTVVSTKVTNYAKDNGLLGREGHLKKDGTLSKQYITPDEKLKSLIGDPEDLTFFSLQRALNPHFVAVGTA